MFCSLSYRKEKNIVFTVHIVGNLNLNRTYKTLDVHVTENSTSSPRYNLVNIIIHLVPAIRSARKGNSSLIIVIVFMHKVNTILIEIE